MLHGFDEICLSVVKNLTSNKLNMSLSGLIDNDQAILAPNDYMPKIWECSWYNDDTLAGYQKGDVVWKWIMTSTEFLDNYWSLVSAYASQNSRLSSYFIDKCYTTAWHATTPAEQQKWHNVISGYSEGSRQIYGPMFDYCFDYKTNRYSPYPSHSIEIYISLSDDNKALLSDTSHWRNIAIKNDAELCSYLSSEVSSLLQQHIRDYHLGGLKHQSEFNEILLKRDFSNFSIDKAYNALKVRDHLTYVNGQGVDYVVKFGKSTLPSHLSGQDDARPLHRWYRRWSSGYLEHGGIVEIPSAVNQLDISSYEVCVKLDWTDGLVTAEKYDYPLAPSSIYSDQFDLLYFGKLDGEAVEQAYDPSNQYLSVGHRYSIELTPIAVVKDDLLSTGKFAKFEQLSGLAYPECSKDKNKTYVNFEVHKVRNDSFCIVRSNTDDLGDIKSPRYVQYYTCGYIAKPDRDYSMSACRVDGMMSYYNYTGPSISDSISFTVVTNDGETLVKDQEYIAYYCNEDGTPATFSGIGQYYLKIEGKAPYKGSIVCKFILCKDISTDGYSIGKNLNTGEDIYNAYKAS